MFTGIIEATARVLDLTPRGLTVGRPKSFTDLRIGSSVCVAGVCLSVVKLTKTSMQFDVIPETLKKSRLGSLTKGDRVNLERALKASDRFDGHVVQGHVEGVGVVMNNTSLFHLRIPIGLMGAVFSKGSITIDGVSLTVAKIDGGHIWIALIPHTLKYTTLGELEKGDLVNVETDLFLRGDMNIRQTQSRKRKNHSGKMD